MEIDILLTDKLLQIKTISQNKLLYGLLTLARLGLVTVETFLPKRHRGVEQDNRARKFTQRYF